MEQQRLLPLPPLQLLLLLLLEDSVDLAKHQLPVRTRPQLPLLKRSVSVQLLPPLRRMRPLSLLQLLHQQQEALVPPSGPLRLVQTATKTRLLPLLLPLLLLLLEEASAALLPLQQLLLPEIRRRRRLLLLPRRHPSLVNLLWPLPHLHPLKRAAVCLLPSPVRV